LKGENGNLNRPPKYGHPKNLKFSKGRKIREFLPEPLAFSLRKIKKLSSWEIGVPFKSVLISNWAVKNWNPNNTKKVRTPLPILTKANPNGIFWCLQKERFKLRENGTPWVPLRNLRFPQPGKLGLEGFNHPKWNQLKFPGITKLAFPSTLNQ